MAWLHVSERDIRSWTMPTLLRRYEWIARSRWDEVTTQVMATQLGVSRALAMAFSQREGRRLPDLPTYDGAMSSGPHPGPQLPEWMREFERANLGRCIQTFEVENDGDGRD